MPMAIAIHGRSTRYLPGCVVVETWFPSVCEITANRALSSSVSGLEFKHGIYRQGPYSRCDRPSN